MSDDLPAARPPGARALAARAVDQLRPNDDAEPGEPALAAARHLQGPGIPDVLTEATRMAGAVLEGAKLRSVHHRAGRSISHVYAATLRAEGRSREVLLVGHVDAQPMPEGSFELVSEGDRIAVWRFPFDPFLPGLASAVDRDRVRELLDRLGALPGRIELYTRAYRPSRRAVVEVRIHDDGVAGRILYLKVLAGRRADELAGIHRQLAGHVPVPAVIGVASAQGILALEALDGRTLRSALVEGLDLPDPLALVELSDRFAASGLTSRRDPRAFADPLRHVAPLRSLVPELGDRLQGLAQSAAAVQGPLVAVHGDLHDGQLLLTDGQLAGLLDVDGSGTGHLSQDAGNLVAHLQVLGEVWPEARDRAEDYAARVADAYRPRVGADALARATAGAWLGLATGPHRAQDENWREATRARIERAARELGDLA